MLNLIHAFAARFKREEGQTVVEYALVLGGVSLALIALLVGAGLGAEFEELVDRITTAMGNTI